ncbi:MAG: hypothetical protein K2Y37_02925 [Pirellulales bacterium]|nr:hypothetical protein [Pirellulales bacterium]
MITLAERITTELGSLVGQPIVECSRAANMQMFGFGTLQKKTNRKGEVVEVSQLSLHIQCRWRLVDANSIVFGRDDLLYPADDAIPWDDFDWDKNPSVLDVVQLEWFAQRLLRPLKVVSACGDNYGGFQISLGGDFGLEAFPCDSRRGEYSEHWRLFGHRDDGSHFVITGDGVLGGDT